MTDMKEKRSGLVSIIVPVYNAAQFITETISRVQQQTYDDWELLLVDDCSTDMSRELICQKSTEDPRIRTSSCQRRIRMAAPRGRETAVSGRREDSISAFWTQMISGCRISSSVSWNLFRIYSERKRLMPDLCLWGMSLRTDQETDLEKSCTCQSRSLTGRH